MATDSSPGSLKELATSRARFIAELGERVASIRHGLARVGATAEASAELNAVRRRLHALAAAAEVLHFTAAADALGRAQTALAALASAPSPAPARERVARVLDLVPSLALGAAIDLREEVDGERARSPREPLSVLVFGDAALEAALHKPGPMHGAETHATTDPDQLLTLLTRFGPDVLLVDGDDPRVVDALPRLRQAAGASPFSLAAVGSFDSYEAMLRLVRRGVARVLPKPVEPAVLQRTLMRLVPREPLSTPRPNPFAGSEGSLVEVIGSEARKAFELPAAASSPAALSPPSSLATLGGEMADQALAALWSAFARLRVLATKGGEGQARFPLEGPHGMIPLAPAIAEASAKPHESAVGEAIAGRRFVVADADPTLLGALTRTLQRLGASVLPARDGVQALELCERQWPDALITDALLPSLSGFDLCRKIRDDIALADLPVAVICWKEHLLEHARRLTEHQGGERPLDPEAFAPLAEALGKRVALERRLERHDAVHGRIDGLTPRLLLQLACSRTPSALLSVRAGRLTIEIAVVDGRPVHARLNDPTGVAAEGPDALGPFLGMRIGRFSMVPLSTAPPAHFSGDVMTVLAPAIARGRRARAWLAGPDALELERVELEPRVTALYLEEAPAAHKALANRLLRGESLRALVDPADPGGGDKAQLVSLLSEVGRRGGLCALIDREGVDVLGPDARGSTASRGSRSPDPPAAVVLPAALSLAEAVLQAVSAPLDQSDKPSARRTNPGLAPPSPPAEPYRSRKASTPPLPDAELGGARRGSVPPPATEGRPSSVIPGPPGAPEASRASVIPAAPDARRASVIPPAADARRASVIPPASGERRASVIPPEPAEQKDPSEPMPLSVRRGSVVPPAPRNERSSTLPTPPSGLRSSMLPTPAAGSRISSLPPAPVGARISSLPPAPGERRRNSWVPMPSPESRPPSRPSQVPPAPSRISSLPPAPAGRALDSRTSVLPPAPGPLDGGLELGDTSRIREPVPDPVRVEPREVPEAWSSAPDEDARRAAPREAELEDDDEPAKTFGGRARAVLGPVVVTLGAAGLAFVGMRVIMGGAFEDLGARPSTQVLGNLASDAALERRNPSTGESAPSSPASQNPPARASRALRTEGPGAVGASPAGPVGPALPPRTPADAGPADAGPSYPGRDPIAIPLDVSVSAELLDPLPEQRLAPGQGMLEVSTWEAQRIYVDDVFVGNYARRLVPLKPGTHQLRLLAGAREIVQPVQIQAGRRTRVSARTKLHQ